MENKLVTESIEEFLNEQDGEEKYVIFINPPFKDPEIQGVLPKQKAINIAKKIVAQNIKYAAVKKLEEFKQKFGKVWSRWAAKNEGLSRGEDWRDTMGVGIKIKGNAPNGGSGTSYHGVNINTTPRSLVDFCEANGIEYGEYNNGSDKVNFDFDFELLDGTQFTVYDWKEYRKLEMDEVVEFHIGGNDTMDCLKGKEALEQVL